MQCSQYYMLVILCTVKKLTRPISWLWACSYQILMTIYTEQSLNQMVKKCMEYEVEGPRPTGRPKRTWREVVREDCQARKLNKEDAMDRCKWMEKDDKGCPMIRMGVSGWMFLLVLAYPGSPGQKAVKRLCKYFVCWCAIKKLVRHVSWSWAVHAGHW